MMPWNFGRAQRPAILLLLSALACARTPESLPEAARFSLSVPSDRTLHRFAVSANGEWLAYSAETRGDPRRRLFLLSIGQEATADDQEVMGGIGARDPFFSPDGGWVAFFARGAIWKAQTRRPLGPPSNAAPQRICDAPADTAGGTWTDDGRIVFAALGDGLMEVPITGGTPVALTTLDVREGELDHGWPSALPTGAIVFTVAQRGRDAHLEVLTAAKKRIRLQAPVVGQAQFVASGHLTYSYLGNLMAVAFDTDELRTRGVPVMIARGIQTSPAASNLGRAGFSVSRTGTLAWLRSSSDDAKTRLVRVDPTGTVSPLSAPPGVYQTPRISRDGRRVAVVVRPDVITREIRVLDLKRPDRVLLTVVGGDNQSPAWMPDGRLTFGSNRDGLQKIYAVSIDPAVRPSPLLSADVAAARNPASWARTLPILAFYEIDPGRRRDVLLYRVGESITPIAATAANERSPVLSPDGQWVAYVSDASGRDQIHIKSLNAALDAPPVATFEGVEPVWAQHELFYRAGDGLMGVDANTKGLSEPRQLFEGTFDRDPGANLANYDVDPQSRSFIMLKSALVPRELRVVVNWGTELTRQVPSR
jgi:Tol biopolymer transport system component